MKDKILFGLVLNTKDGIIRKRNEVSYHITGLKALNISTFTFEDFSWLVVSDLYCQYIINEESRFVVTRSKNEIDSYSIRTDGEEQDIASQSPLPLYSEDGSLFLAIGDRDLYFRVSRAILIKLSLQDNKLSFITGIDARVIGNYIEESSYTIYGSVLSLTGELSNEQKYSLLSKISENVYSLGCTVYVKGTVEKLVLPKDTKSLEVDNGYIKELVCNESLESIVLFGKMPDKLYISKKASKKLLCSILYSSSDPELKEYGANKLRNLILSLINAKSYDKIMDICRSEECKVQIDSSLSKTEVIVY